MFPRRWGEKVCGRGGAGLEGGGGGRNVGLWTVGLVVVETDGVEGGMKRRCFDGSGEERRRRFGLKGRVVALAVMLVFEAAWS